MSRHAAYRVCSLMLIVALFVPMAAVPAVAEEDQAAAKLPLKRVVLFTSGVGFFERRGEIEGDAAVELQFDVDDINDLLKSMVLEDRGGRIGSISYTSKDPITRTLRTFAIDLTDNPSLAELLDQIRGEQVEIEAPNRITGIIVGVEKRRQQVGKDETIEIDVLNLLTADGLRSVPLPSVGRIKIVNEELDAEFRQALAVLAGAHATDKKTVKLDFRGQGRRPVRVGYVQETPLWKTSYRLVLGEDQTPFLQGWAIVENTTEDDWNDVALSLVSGRPISFIMNLYDPLYVSRPVVEPELFASLRPPTYEQDLAAAAAPGAPPMAKAESTRQLRAGRAANRLFLDEQAEDTDAFVGGGMGGEGGFDIQQGVESLASAGDVGELFEYAIDTPVTLPRRQSAMLPIVNASIDGQKVSIYDENVQAKHPLNGLELTNSTSLHLMQGPITVFDGGSYAGDSRIEDLPPGAKRLISYALDLDVEVAPEQKSRPRELTTVKIIKGTLHSTYKQQREKTYTVKNSGKEAKKVLIEYPRDADWKLTAPAEPEETTRNRYRFAVTAEPGEPAKLTVEEEQTSVTTVAMGDVYDQLVQYYIRSDAVSDKVKEALQEVMRRKLELAKLTTAREQRQAEIAAITTEQDRIRKNLGEIERNSDLYNRYITKLTEQEDQIETLREAIAKLTEEETKKRQELDAYLAALDVS